MLRKSPYSLPRGHYGGVRKRLFIGLMVGSCLLLCTGILLLWLIPYVGLAAIHPSLPWGLGILSVVSAASVGWMCLGLVYHIYTGEHLAGVRRIRGLTVRLMLPFMELLGRALGIPPDRVRLSFIKVNNEMVLASRLKAAAQDVLLLLPHCVQRSRCPHRLSVHVERCAGCGQCPVGGILALCRRWGVRMAIATGGTIARRVVVETRPKLIVAVACERDLTSGIQDAYPVPVYGVLNARPYGPCMDTLVEVDVLEKVLLQFIMPEEKEIATA